MSPFYMKTLSAKVAGPDGEQSFSFLRYATLDDGIFGRTTDTAFLIDVGESESDSPNWADAFLDAGHGEVTTQRRDKLAVTFRLADESERERAFAHVNEIRPAHGSRPVPDETRIILAQVVDS